MIRISKTKYLGRVARCYQYSTFNQEAIHFEQTVMRRSSVRAFNDTPIPHETFSHILSLTQRTPTGYNLQPWVAVVVNDETKKHELHEAALSQKKILEAPATVVFAANHHVLENLDHILKQQVESGSWDKEYAERTRVLANALLRTDHCQLLQYVTTTGMSFFKPMMQAPINTRAYAQKSAMMAAMTFMLAASSHGLSTHAMEGFDERRVKNVVQLPSHFSVPVIISIGYSDNTNQIPSTRLPTEMVYKSNTYDQPINST